MEFIQNFFTLKPLHFHWIEVSPADERGLDYHLSPNLCLRIEEIFSGSQEFSISEILVSLEDQVQSDNPAINRMQEEHIFMREMMPNKTQARITRHFRDPDISIFFNNKQMDYLEELFENHNFIAKRITVMLNGHRVDDIIELGPSDFKLVMEMFEELEVQGGIDYVENKKEFMDAYNDYFREKVAKHSESQREGFWAKMKRKDERKKILKTSLFITLGVACWVGKRVLLSCGWPGKLCAIPLGAVGVVFDMHGQAEAMGLLRSVKIKPEGMY